MSKKSSQKSIFPLYFEKTSIIKHSAAEYLSSTDNLRQPDEHTVATIINDIKKN